MGEMVDSTTLELLQQMNKVALSFARKTGSAVKATGHVGAKAVKGTAKAGAKAVKAAGSAASKSRVEKERRRRGKLEAYLKGDAAAGGADAANEKWDSLVRSSAGEEEAMGYARRGFAELNDSFFIRSNGEELKAGLAAYTKAIRAGWAHGDIMIAAAYYSDWCAAQAAAGNTKNALMSCAEWLHRPENGKSGLEKSAYVAKVGPGFKDLPSPGRNTLIYAATDDQRNEVLHLAEDAGYSVYSYDTTAGELNQDRAFWRYAGDDGRDLIVSVYELVPVAEELGVAGERPLSVDRATGTAVYAIDGETVEVPRTDTKTGAYLRQKYSLDSHEKGIVEAPRERGMETAAGVSEFVADTPEQSEQIRGFLDEIGMRYSSSPIPGGEQVVIKIKNRDLAEGAGALQRLADMTGEELMGMYPQGQSPAELARKRQTEALTLARRIGPAKGQEARTVKPKAPEKTPAQDQMRCKRAARAVNKQRTRDLNRTVKKSMER